MKVLISALACEPGKGSELEVGYRTVLAAARHHEVWVLLNASSIPAVRAAVAGTAAEARIHLEGIEFGLSDEAFARLTTPGFHWYYDRWQRRAATRAAELDRQLDFDLVHHVTLASYWTRTAAASVGKPLVWGPVGGGVETPWRLVPALGWRGLREDLGRLLVRRALARLGPARHSQEKARITFAQNEDTAGRLGGPGAIAVLSNATVVDVDDVRPSAPRGADLYLVGRLVPWKAPILAVHAMRYVTAPDCLLRICGDGPERRRLERAARRWGVQDRVRFEGWLTREVLLERLASAGALVHPALHEEAGLCVAEALALGTPVVCLDRGGPAELLAEWPDTRAVAVKPATVRSTARAMAAAVNEVLAAPPEVRQKPVPPQSSFEAELLVAYDRAVGTVAGPRRPLGRSVWAFPRGKPQIFASTPKTLGKGVPLYAFGRRLPVVAHAGVGALVTVPGLRSLLAERRGRPDPVCGWSRWADLVEQVEARTRRVPHDWLHFRSQWTKQRSSAVALDDRGTPLFLVVVEAADRASFHPDLVAGSFRVPACLDSFSLGDWQVRVVEPLPRYHRAVSWDPARIKRVVAEIADLGGSFPRVGETPPHWRPMHGDLVPWNLREDGAGRFWLVDWEDAGWGPPSADAVRYLVASHSLRVASPLGTVQAVREAFDIDQAGLADIARFWLRHHNLRPVADHPEISREKARDATRATREIAVFRVMSGDHPEPAT